MKRGQRRGSRPWNPRAGSITTARADRTDPRRTKPQKKKKASKKRSSAPTPKQIAFAEALYREVFPGRTYQPPESKKAASNDINHLLRLKRGPQWSAQEHTRNWASADEFALVEQAMAKQSGAG